MKNFLTDLWHDLREKRLWPVAVVLLAALVAVPVVLSKPSEEPAPAAPTEARTAPEPRELKGLATVKLETSETGTGSSLDTFDPSNPFRPPRRVLKGAEAADSVSIAESGQDSGEPKDTGSATSGGDTGTVDTGGDTGTVDTGGGDTGTVDTGDGDTGGDTTTTTQYAYVIDVRFRDNGRTRRIDGMKRLDMLPNPASPLLLFLGVSAGGGNAVFLVDSALDAVGEGRCKPSNDNCAFLHIGAGSEHEFTTDDGDSYQLEVVEIRKVKVDAKRSARSSKKNAKKGATANAAVGAPTTPRRFMPPLLADLVSVSSSRPGDSNSHTDRR